MSLSGELKKRIDDFHESLIRNHPWFRAIYSGPVDPGLVRLMIENLLELVRHTPGHLQLAIAESKKQGLDDMVRLFENKVKEEAGHDAWGEKDLRVLDKTLPRGPGQTGVLPSMTAFIDTIADTIRRDPCLYLPYIYFAEYFTVISGPGLIRNLGENSGIPARALSIIGNHAELDQDHVGEWDELIPKYVDESRYREVFFKVIDEFCQLYEGFCHELAGAGRKVA